MEFRIEEYFLKLNNSNELIENLVALLKIIVKYPYLYDQTLSVFFWEYLKEKTWELVAKEMKCSVETCQAILINCVYISLLSKQLKLNFPDTLELVFFMVKDTGRFDKADKTKEQNGLKKEKETRETLPSTQDRLMSPTKNKWFSFRRLWEIISHWFASLCS